tara:strand:+ start:179 stop:643 length:465 start_codon:yes stop_codon:yes gene_type:complete
MESIKFESQIKNFSEDNYELRFNGQHFFDVKCSLEKNINPIYREKIWPYVFNLRKNKIMMPTLTKKDNYPRFNFSLKDKKQIFIYMHQLVMILLKPTQDKNKIINHINRNTFDYRPENLEWVSPSENSKGNVNNRLDYNKLYDFYHNYKQNLCV